MIDIQQNVLDYILTNLPEYKTWIEDKYSTEGYILSALNFSGIYDTMDCQMPALMVIDAGKDGGEPVRINATVKRNANLDIYIVDRVIDQRQAELTILMYGEIFEQMFVDLYNDDTKKIEGLRSVLLNSWTPFDVNVQTRENEVDTYKVGRQSITGLSQIFGRG